MKIACQIKSKYYIYFEELNFCRYEVIVTSVKCYRLLAKTRAIPTAS